MKVKNVTIIMLSCSLGLIFLLITSSSCGPQSNGWLCMRKIQYAHIHVMPRVQAGAWGTLK